MFGQLIVKNPDTDLHDTMEGLLASIYSNYPEDEQAFDCLPDPIKAVALQAASVSLVRAANGDDTCIATD
ncbi:hypothetical protein RCO28_23200 [Streptomyces sp. LHD-70]|uniref:hypothetical protein n=1 Tax=Streptomyces sp. LHD-70 TaxID=3072140 RepID=UPI002810995B|nr:hypothetical protein [Streptomyces sp. LHD-70]MDQ8705380.1 hypothetical protein [Streptomyces sp. LHD-70]